MNWPGFFFFVFKVYGLLFPVSIYSVWIGRCFLLEFTVYGLLFLARIYSVWIIVSCWNLQCMDCPLFLARIYSVWIVRWFLLEYTVYELATVSCKHLQCMNWPFFLFFAFKVNGLLFPVSIYSMDAVSCNQWFLTLTWIRSCFF